MAKEVFPNLRYDPLRYLLGSRRAAWVKYQTLVRILGKDPNDKEVLIWRDKRDASAAVQRLRDKQQPGGSFPCMPWRHVHKFYFNRLVLMGYDLQDLTVRKAIESLLNDQLSGGGYNPDLRTADGRESPLRKQEGHWSPCMTGFVTKTLIDLGLKRDRRVRVLLSLLSTSQRESGGWICRREENRSSYCILGGTPWALVALVTGGIYGQREACVQQALRIFDKHKQKIMRHGYHRDLCYRCDEALLLPSLCTAGLTKRDPLLRDLYASLVNKQRPDGSWRFRGKASPWYTIEAVAALQLVDDVRSRS